ncbi:MAG: type II secretion system protein [Planctomycetes bacterium]|nr:type II secretion system protein [Planctomycetota bacterium]
MHHEGVIRMRCAFTLIELLVTVSIIGILAALLLPTLGLVREASRKTVCANNQRQFMMATIAYTQDNGGLTPPTTPGTDTLGRWVYIRLINLGYMPDEYVLQQDGLANWVILRSSPNPFQCPSIQPPSPNKDLAYGPMIGADWAALGLKTIKQYTAFSYRLSDLHPSMPFIAESVRVSNPSVSMYWSNTTTPLWAGYDGYLRLAHRGSAVVAYKDGHVAARTKSQLMTEDYITYAWSPP